MLDKLLGYAILVLSSKGNPKMIVAMGDIRHPRSVTRMQAVAEVLASM